MIEPAPGLMFGPINPDSYTGVDVPRMRRERADRMRQVLRKAGIPAIVVCGANNVRYLTGVSSFEQGRQSAYAAFFADGDPVVFAPAGTYHQLPDLCPWISRWEIARTWFGGIAGIGASEAEAKLFASELATVLAEHGVAGEQVALAEFDALATTALQEAGVNTVPGTYLLLEASAVKTIDEIRCLQMAASISSAGFDAAVRTIRPGRTQDEVAKAMSAAMGGLGADQVRSKLLSGPLGFERPVTDMTRIMEFGDFGYARTCATSYMGYTCCIYRTFSVGKEPDQRAKDWYKVLRERVDSIAAAIRPGASTADAAREFAPASKWGFKDESEVLTVEFGHGVGLVRLQGAAYINYNWPLVNRQWSLEHPQELKEGMVIAVESLEGERRVGGVRVENMLLVTKDGAVTLDRYPDQEILVGGL